MRISSKQKNKEAKLFRQIYDSIKNQIETGTLKPGAKLPSTRTLAATLNVSRHTVRRSYEELSSQGYIKLSKGLRPQVVKALADSAVAAKSSKAFVNENFQLNFEVTDFARRIIDSEGLSYTAIETLDELNAGGAPLSELPVNTWRKAIQKFNVLSPNDLSVYIYDPFGSISLRTTLASYLNRSRGIITNVENIAVYNYTECGTDMLCRLFINPGDNVVVENPGTPGARMMFKAHGANLIQLNIDRNKIDLSELDGVKAKFIYLTPSHHDPIGTVMDLNYRKSLIQWAHANNVLIIEDDYDCEYHFTRPVQPSLKGLDEYGVVIYRYNFWRTLFPLTKLGFIVLPSPLVPLLHKVKTFVERNTTLIEQDALSYFINEGYFERHIKQTRSMYMTKRTAILSALTKYFKSDLNVYDGGGIQIILTFNKNFDSPKILKAAHDSKFPIISTADYYLSKPVANEFILFYTHFPVYLIEERIKDFAQKLLGK